MDTSPFHTLAVPLVISSSVIGYFLLINRQKKRVNATDLIEQELQQANKRVHKEPEYRLPLEIIGKGLNQVPTPSLIIELEDYEHNLALMKKTLYESKCDHVQIRAHFKAHKCGRIAYDQITFGSCVGFCCQKLSEAVALIDSHLQDIDVFISNEIVDETKLRRLIKLALLHPDGDVRNIKLSTCVDDINVVRLITRLCEEEVQKNEEKYNRNKRPKLNILIEYNVGQDRCGVQKPETFVQIVKQIQKCSLVHFRGIHAYNGKNQHIRKYSDRKNAVTAVVDRVKELLAVLEKENIKAEVVTGGGTGTYIFEATSNVYTEIQPGSYVLMDADYGLNLDENDNYIVSNEHNRDGFRQSLFLLSTVISKPETGDRVVLDAGLKAVSCDCGDPLPVVPNKPLRESGVKYTYAGDEHGILRGDISNYNVGDRVLLVPSHCDPTVNLHDYFVCIRNGKVEEIWPITARGPGL
jgi:3-hydroxy-D-aspartate aldolase